MAAGDGSGGEKARGESGLGPSRSNMGHGWAFLKNPTERDVRGKKRRRKALDKPLSDFKYLVVLDFEWTCDDRRRVAPSEIIEFPSVLVKTTYPPMVVSEFQTYCRPTVNPTLSTFCKHLTGISQEDVDRGVSLHRALDLHAQWLRENGLATGAPGGAGLDLDLDGRDWATVTWGDSDIMTTLRNECKAKGLPFPAHFRKWINLKVLFQRHYKREAKGGLKACVESCCGGNSFEGRPHSGIVDSRNTAKIVMHMLRTGFRFRANTRGFGPDGLAWGQQRRKKEGEGEKRKDESQING